MRRILVTGARGLLGSSLVPYLQERGHHVLSHGRTGDVAIRGDLSDPAQARAALSQASPDVIVNLVALTNVDTCEQSPQEAYLANVRVVENLGRWIEETHNRCHLIQLSTDQVYDGPGPHSENDITLTNYYGFSKYAAELAAAAVQSTVLRTNFFGPSRCANRVSLSDWLFLSLRKGDPITVFDDVRFSPLSLQRLTELLEIVIVNGQAGVFNLGSREAMSKADFAFALAASLGLPTQNMKRGSSGAVKLVAYRPKDMSMNSSLFEKAFDVRLPTLSEEINSVGAAYVHETQWSS